MSTQMNKYAKTYIDNYLAQALAQRSNAPQPLAQNTQAMPQDLVAQQGDTQLAQILAQQQQQQQPQRQIAPQPMSPVDYSDAQGQFNNAIEAGGDYSPLAIALAGMTGAVDAHGKKKAEEEQKEYLAQALASGDPYALAAAGQTDLAKILLQQQANEQERQENRAFKMSERGMNREDDLAKLLMQQQFQREEHELNRDLSSQNAQQQAQMKQQELAAKEAEKQENLAREEYRAKRAYLQKILSPTDFVLWEKYNDVENYIKNRDTYPGLANLLMGTPTEKLGKIDINAWEKSKKKSQTFSGKETY